MYKKISHYFNSNLVCWVHQYFKATIVLRSDILLIKLSLCPFQYIYICCDHRHCDSKLILKVLLIIGYICTWKKMISRCGVFLWAGVSWNVAHQWRSFLVCFSPLVDRWICFLNKEMFPQVTIKITNTVLNYFFLQGLYLHA